MGNCMFIGHSDCPNTIEPFLYNTIKDLIISENVLCFYVGTHGRFNKLVYKVLCKLELEYKIKTVVVLPYLNKKEYADYYDMKKTIFPDILTKTPLRFTIDKCNLYMLSKSEYMVCYLENTMTNTYTYVKKALTKKLNVINIGPFDLQNII